MTTVDSPSRRYRLGLAGMGGFAGAHQQTACEMEAAGWAQLVCTCDPAPETFPTLLADLQARGVRVFHDFGEMLTQEARGLDLVGIPTPVPLHAPMHRAAVGAGLAVYLEKPPTLYHLELEEMIEADRSARVPTLVGFNFIGEPTRCRLKQRLLAGEFGPLREVRLRGFWPRLSSYYARSAWAARLLLGGRVVLDSCIGNALAHYVQNLLFWAGPERHSVAPVSEVQAQLYRTHPIESFDTVLLRACLLPAHVVLKLVVTHACEGQSEHVETVVCRDALIDFQTTSGYAIRWHDGRTETTGLDPMPYSLVRHNYANLFRVMDGRCPRPFTTLADCRSFVALNNLAFLSSQVITTVQRPHAQPFTEKGGTGVAIQGLRAVGDRFMETGEFPDPLSVPWAGPAPRRVGLVDLPQFTPEWLARLLPHRQASPGTG